MSLYLTAIVKSKPGNASALKTVLEGIVAPSRREEANIQYDLHQSTADEHVFIFHEEWRDEAGFAAHNAQPYIRDFIEKTTELAAGPVEIHFTKRLA